MRIQRVNFYNKNTFTSQQESPIPAGKKTLTAEDLMDEILKKYSEELKELEYLANQGAIRDKPLRLEDIKKLNLSQKQTSAAINVIQKLPINDLYRLPVLNKFFSLPENTFSDENMETMNHKIGLLNICGGKCGLNEAVILPEVKDEYINKARYKGPWGVIDRAIDYQKRFKNTDSSISLLKDSNFKTELENINQKLKASLEESMYKGIKPALLGHIAFDANIEDSFLTDKIQNKLNDFNHKKWRPYRDDDSFRWNRDLYNSEIPEIMIIQDVVNSYKNNYTPIKRVYENEIGKFGKSHYDYEDALDKLTKAHAKEQGISEKEAKKKINKRIGRGTSQFAKDFEQSIKNAPLQDYIEAFGEKDPKTATHLYNKYYLAQYPKQIQTKCKQIAQKFGTFIFLPSDYDNANLNFIHKELSRWKKAGKDDAVIPKMIICSPIDDIFVRSQARGAASQNRKIIYIKRPKDLEYALRHEIFHLNEPIGNNKFEKFEYFQNEKNLKLIRKKQLFRAEFLKAGIDKGRNNRHINHAYLNGSEFLAVASEGDMKKYSQELKNLLESLGMKRWIMRLAHRK